MKPVDVVRAWKDEEYRLQLSAEARASLPANPAGAMELNDADLGAVAGGAYSTEYFETFGCCQGITEAGKCDITAGFGYPGCTALCITIWLTTKSVCNPSEE